MPWIDAHDDLDEPFDYRLFREVQLERRAMFIASSLALVLLAGFAVAIALPKFAEIDFPANRSNETVVVDLGIFGERRSVKEKLANGDFGQTLHSQWIAHFPPSPDVSRLANKNMPHFYRAQVAFSLICALLIVAATGAALFSCREHHVMYKRATAGLYAVAGVSAIVVVEVLVFSVDEWNTKDSCDSNVDPICYQRKVAKRIALRRGLRFEDFKITYGLSYYASWVVAFGIFIIALVYVWCSRRRRGLMAALTALDEGRSFDSIRRQHDEQLVELRRNHKRATKKTTSGSTSGPKRPSSRTPRSSVDTNVQSIPKKKSTRSDNVKL